MRTHLCWCAVLPHVDELGEHAVGTTALVLAQPAKGRQLIIRHTHVILQERGCGMSHDCKV